MPILIDIQLHIRAHTNEKVVYNFQMNLLKEIVEHKNLFIISDKDLYCTTNEVEWSKIKKEDCDGWGIY